MRRTVPGPPESAGQPKSEPETWRAVRLRALSAALWATVRLIRTPGRPWATPNVDLMQRAPPQTHPMQAVKPPTQRQAKRHPGESPPRRQTTPNTHVAENNLRLVGCTPELAATTQHLIETATCLGRQSPSTCRNHPSLVGSSPQLPEAGQGYGRSQPDVWRIPFHISSRPPQTWPKPTLTCWRACWRLSVPAPHWPKPHMSWPMSHQRLADAVRAMVKPTPNSAEANMTISTSWSRSKLELSTSAAGTFANSSSSRHETS